MTTTAIDPVCGMTVDPATTAFRAEHDGQIYYFCARGCMLEFQDDPARFLSDDHQPTDMYHAGAEQSAGQ